MAAVLNQNCVLSLQFRNNLFKVVLSTVEIRQGTSEELMTKEESNRWDIDSLIQKTHREGVPETMEGDVLVDACRFN